MEIKILSKENSLEALDNYEFLDNKALSALKDMVAKELVVLERNTSNPQKLNFKLTEKGIKFFKQLP